MRRFLDTKDFLLQLIRLGIGNEDPDRVAVPESVDWDMVKAFASEQELSAVVFDGMERLRACREDFVPTKKLFRRWIVEVMSLFEQRYEMYRHTIGEMAAFYNRHGYKMMVFKGYACSLAWPKPNHRPCGDIDIWQFGQCKEADKVLEKEMGIKVDSSKQHHTVFQWRNFMVENHYDFLNVHLHKCNAELEHILKQMGMDDSHSVEVDGQTVYVPSPNLHALYLLCHSANHIVTMGFTLRMLLDWAFLVKKYGREIDWKWLEETVDRFGMRGIYDIFNAICVEDLGFESSVFPAFRCEEAIKERLLDDIVSPETPDILPKNFFRRVLFRLRRWKSNEWKHKLCFKESMWTSFWYGTLSHLVKPSSI